MRMRASLMILVMSVSIAATAQEPPPPKKIFELKRLMGQYQCKGTDFAFAGQPEHKVVSVLTGKLIYNDNVLELIRTEKKTDENPNPIEVRGYFVWDEADKKFDYVGVVSDGGWFMETSPGSEGGVFNFTGLNHLAGVPAVKGRDTWKPGSIFNLSYKFEVEEKGTWTKVVEENCTRE